MNYISKKWIIIFFILMCFTSILSICDSKNNIEKFSDTNPKITNKISNLINVEDISNKRNIESDNKITLNKYFEGVDIDKSLKELNKKLSNKNLSFNKENTVGEVTNILFIKEITNKLNGGMENLKSIFRKIIDQSSYPICGSKGFIDYCQNGIVTTKKEKFGNLKKEIKYFIKNGNFLEKFGDTEVTTDFKKISMKDAISRFFESDNKLLNELFITFKNKYKRDYNNFSKKDLYILAVMFIKDIKILIKDIKETKGKKDKTSKKRRRNAIMKFIPARDLFYQIKHHFKILSVYLLFNKFIKDKDKNSIANVCCSPNKIDNTRVNLCHNFSKKAKNSEPRIYGFSKFGYVKDTKCKDQKYYELNLEDLLIKVIGDDVTTKSLFIQMFVYNNILKKSDDKGSYKIKDIKTKTFEKTVDKIKNISLDKYKPKVTKSFEKEKSLIDKDKKEFNKKLSFIEKAKLRSEKVNKIVQKNIDYRNKIKKMKDETKKQLKKLVMKEEERKKDIIQNRINRKNDMKNRLILREERIKEKVEKINKKYDEMKKKDETIEEERLLMLRNREEKRKLMEEERRDKVRKEKERLYKIAQETERKRKLFLQEQNIKRLRLAKLEQERLKKQEEERLNRIRLKNLEIKAKAVEEKRKRMEKRKLLKQEEEQRIAKIKYELEEQRIKEEQRVKLENEREKRRAKLLEEEKMAKFEKERLRKQKLLEEEIAIRKEMRKKRLEQIEIQRQRRLLLEEEERERKAILLKQKLKLQQEEYEEKQRLLNEASQKRKNLMLKKLKEEQNLSRLKKEKERSLLEEEAEKRRLEKERIREEEVKAQMESLEKGTQAFLDKLNKEQNKGATPCTNQNFNQVCKPFVENGKTFDKYRCYRGLCTLKCRKKSQCPEGYKCSLRKCKKIN